MQRTTTPRTYRDPTTTTPCGMLYERAEELGDNGGCDFEAAYICASCSTPICGYHAWFNDAYRDAICSTCNGIAGCEHVEQPTFHRDPTDDYHVIQQEQMLRGICSAPDCQWPIAAWCVDKTCRAKLCLDHAQEHRNLHARERLEREHHCADCGEPLPGDEYVLQRYEDGTTAWYCLNDAQCAARVFQQRGGKIRDAVADDDILEAL